MQQTTDNVGKTTDGVHRTTGSKAPGNRQHAADTAQKTANNRQRMQQTTCIRQQATCKRTRAHARCKRKHTALPHFVCGEQWAAGNQQHARSIVLDNQCATRHRRHTQDATYDPCRSMQQTQMEPTTRSRRCNVMCEMTTESGSSRTSGLRRAFCAGHGDFAGLPRSEYPMLASNVVVTERVVTDSTVPSSSQRGFRMRIQSGCPIGLLRCRLLPTADERIRQRCRLGRKLIG